jgi:hypothetical protein
MIDLYNLIFFDKTMKILGIIIFFFSVFITAGTIYINKKSK